MKMTIKKKRNRTYSNRFFAIILLLFCLTTAGWAQQKISISGTVTDPSGETLPGVSIIVAGTQQGTITDIDGNYTISVPTENSKLNFSYLGYETQTKTVGANRQINVVLLESSTMLDEVVAIGYAKVKRKDLTGSSVSVGGNELAIAPVTTAAQALAGKAAGVNVVSQSGAPGAEINITVRGGTSITQSSKPLYIVDGFQMEDGLQNVDINDIESIDVMKDASATAIYGTRGSNGVILITTKSGKSGKTEVSYNGYLSFEKLGKKLDVLEIVDYVKYQYEFQNLAGNTEKWASMFGGGDPALPGFYTGAYDYIENTYGARDGIDWQDEVFGGTALMQNHNVNISGGTDKTKFMLSYNYTGQDGIMDKHGYDKNSIRAKINHELRKGIRMDFGSNFQSTHIEGGGSMSGALKMTILQPVTGGIRYTNDQLLNTDISDEMLSLDSQYDVYNPIIMNDAVSKDKYTRQSSTNLGIEFDFLKDFMFRSAGNYFWQQVRDDMWDDGRTKTAQNNKGPYGSRNNSEFYTWQITNTLTWNRNFGLHGLSALLGQETYYYESMKLDNEYHEFPDNNFGLNDVSMGKAYTWSSSKSKNGIVSFFGRLMYNYDNRYLVTGILRADGSSKFARGNQWGYFPSGSAAWRISEEGFMKDQEFVNNLKLRFGYGKTGNCNIDNNMYATDYKSGKYAISNSEYGTLVPGDILGNPNLQWETTTSTNLGLDVSILNSRVNLTMDLYNNESDNLLIKNKIPTSTGYTYQFQNIGSIRNRGLELVLNTLNVKTKDFSWSTDFNISFNRSKVLSIYGEGDSDRFIQNYESRIDFLIEVGQPLGQFYGYKYDGVYTTDDFTQNSDGTYALKPGVASAKAVKRSTIKPGDVKYVCTAGQTDADGNPVWSSDDRSVIGNAEPKFTGGMVNTFKYKGFDLTVFMNFSYGNKVFNMSSQRFIGPYLPNQNTLTDMNGRFLLVDPATGRETTDLSRLAAMNPQQHDGDAMWSLNSANKIAITDALDYYLEDGSFLRLNTITLGYTLPNSLLRKASISNLRFYCTLNNIHTFTNFTGYDPEVSATSNLLTRGVDNSSYPKSKSYVFGVNLTF